MSSMGHASQMINSIKNNAAIKNKDNRFRKAYFKQDVLWKTKFQFKEATAEELAKSKKSNANYISQQRKRTRAVLILSTVLAIWVFYQIATVFAQIDLFRIY